jgi:hypothetical protein
MMHFSELSQKFDDLVQLLQNKELVCRACGYREVHVLFPIYSESIPILAIIQDIRYNKVKKDLGHSKCKANLAYFNIQ